MIEFSVRSSLRLLACSSLLLVGPTAERVVACGGPDIVDVGELMAAPRNVVSELLEDSWEGTDLDDFRFLRPFQLAGRDPRGLFEIALTQADRSLDDEPGDEVPRVDLTAFLQAVRDGKLPEAARAAHAIVDEVLSFPTPIANANRTALQRAVEFLELAPQLASLDKSLLDAFFVQRAQPKPEWPAVLRQAQQVRSTERAQLPALLASEPRHVRAATLELVSLVERVHRELPDGWPGQIPAAPELWKTLEQGHDAWLAAHAQHPLADLVRLSQLRLLFLEGDAHRAWDVLLALYPRRPLRAVWEMRHLLQGGVVPADIDLLGVRDPVLATALLRESVPLTVDTWRQLWKRSEQAGEAAWAVNLQERLFVQSLRLARLGTPVKELPGAPAKKSQRWAALHTAALLAAGRDREALAQAQQLTLKDDRVAARLLAQAYMRQCDWLHVAETVRSMGDESLRYLLEVVVDEASLRELSKRSGELGKAATQALAERLVQDGAWQAALDVWAAVDAKRAESWREAVHLAADASAQGRLAFATWLRGPSGTRLFPARSRAYSRGLKRRLDVLRGKASDDPDTTPAPAAPAANGRGLELEQERLAYALTRIGARERALEAYADALRELAPDSKPARAALKQADALYNQILSWDAGSVVSFEPLLVDTSMARTLREVGKRVHDAAKTSKPQ